MAVNFVTSARLNCTISPYYTLVLRDLNFIMCHDMTRRLFPPFTSDGFLMTLRFNSVGLLLCYVISFQLPFVCSHLHFHRANFLCPCLSLLWHLCLCLSCRMYLKICLPYIGGDEAVGTFGQLSRACLAWRGQLLGRKRVTVMHNGCRQLPCAP
jgi:hypothetical protein